MTKQEQIKHLATRFSERVVSYIQEELLAVKSEDYETAILYRNAVEDSKLNFIRDIRIIDNTIKMHIWDLALREDITDLYKQIGEYING